MMYVLLLLLTGLMSGLVAVQDARADGCIIGKPSSTYNTGQKTKEDYCDTAENKYVTQGTLTAGEDQTNNLVMTSGGLARMTTFSSVTSATTSAITTVPTGQKTFFAQIVNATSETKAATLDIYGSPFNSTTYGQKVCTITLPSTVTTLALQDYCPITTSNWLYWYYTVTAYTSASAAPVTVYAQY